MTPSPPTFLESVGGPERGALLAGGTLRRFDAGEVLFREGDRAHGALVITAGLLKIHKHGPDGSELILTLSGPGDLLGEVAVSADARRSADATALEPVEAIVIAVADLRAVLARYPQLALALLELALSRLRTADGRRLESATAESLPRVTNRLIELADRFGVTGAAGEIEVSMPINQDELASWAGTSRESTARALRTLRELGLIETRRRRLVVIDRTRLALHGSHG